MVIGIVGGIASGKSTVARLFESFGAYLIDADRIGHETLLRPSIREKLVERFGSGILASDGLIDRQALGRIIFGDESARQALNQFVRPTIRAEIRERIRTIQKADADRVIVVDAPLLVETGPTDIADIVLLVTAPAALRKTRVIKRNILSDAEAEKRVSAQVSEEKQRRWVDDILENTGSIEELEQQATRLWSMLTQPKGSERVQIGSAIGQTSNP